MKRAAAPTGSAYAQLCARLGVEPKQLAVLLSVAGGAVALLGGKMLLSGPTSATAAAAGDAVVGDAATLGDGAPATAPMTANEPPAGAMAADRSSEMSKTFVRLDSAPRRDPFRPFIERQKAPQRTVSDAPPEEALVAPDMSVYALRATMDDEWVVINGQTLRIGDTVGLATDGTPIKLRAVGHRSATLEWRNKSFEIAFTP